jgi:taurine dioxygenase
MTTLSVSPLSDELPFGVRITGITLASTKDEDVRKQINKVFTDRGMIVFENVEPTNAMQVALSEMFGPLEGHALDIPMADDNIPGLTDFQYKDVFEVDGRELSGFVPWHFDACYTKALNRGGVLRALAISPEGGLTGFADGIQLYNAIDSSLRERFETLDIIYHSHLMFMNLKFGRPRSYNPISVRKMITDMLDNTKDAPRSVHPAIWRRDTGEKVLHVSPWQAAGIEGMEGPEGDTLLGELIAEMEAKMLPYWHAWKPTDMAIWDNWRFMHAASGNPPQYPRHMQRTTIKGDYGLGRFEDPSTSEEPAGITV